MSFPLRQLLLALNVVFLQVIAVAGAIGVIALVAELWKKRLKRDLRPSDEGAGSSNPA